MTISPPAVLRGVQTPRYHLVPPSPTTAGREAVELAASAGLVLEPHQELVLEGALRERPDGTWAAFEVGLVEPRQNGKGGTLEARQLAGLFLFGEELQTHTAHRFDTSLEHFRRVRTLIENTPDLIRRVKRIREANGEEMIELLTGQRLQFKARSKGSGRGFSGDTVYLDEAFWLMDLGSLMPTMSARPNPQLWYTSSAPLPRVESDILRRLCRRGRVGATGRARHSRLAYFEWSADPDSDLSDRSAWAEANPGLGYRLAEEFIESEMGAMSPEEFLRERLGIYPDVLDGDQPVIDPAHWKACENVSSKVSDPITLAFEVSIDRKWACITCSGASNTGTKHVEVLDYHSRTGWVVDRLLELRDRHHPAAIVCNPAGPAGALLPDCEREGLDILKATSRDYAQACGAAHDEITEHRWTHLDQPVLNQAVQHAVERKVGDAWVFDRRSGVDLSPLVAVSLAAWGAGKEAESVYTGRGLVTLG